MAATLRDYEAILARMCLTLADKDPLEVTVDDLREVIDLWAHREARTRREGDVRDPGVLVRGPRNTIRCRSHRRRSSGARVRRAGASAAAAELPDAQTAAAAPTPRDRVGSSACSTSAFAAAELTGLRDRDIDLAAGRSPVFGKGQRAV